MQYSELEGLPKINGVTVVGDKDLKDYGLTPMTDEEVQAIMLEVFGFTL